MYECFNEEELLRDEIESTNTAENRATKNSGDSLVAMIASMNQTMAAMAGSIFSMGNALKRLHADTASPPNDKRPKTTTACHDEPCDEASLDESADLADSSELLQSRSVSSSENSGGGGHRTSSSTQRANSTQLANTNKNGNSKTPGTALEKGADISAKPTRLSSSTTPKASTAAMYEKKYFGIFQFVSLAYELKYTFHNFLRRLRCLSQGFFLRVGVLVVCQYTKQFK
ncbi:unnamed protein product [Porites evermanni]|uniref:Uncharacterized protein n=1 Tax=Porites evermanni TaxID=104178 RepID=A0ABN8M1Y6_9CNID|nr:unnamed protein product [Porites evermanni]